MHSIAILFWGHNTFTDPWGLWPMFYNYFRRNYVAIITTSVKIIGKYFASGVNYA